MGQLLKDLFPHLTDGPGDPPLQQRSCILGSGGRLGLDEIGHGLHAGEIQLSGQKGPLGEFPCLGRTGAQFHGPLQNAGHYRLGAMAENLQQILTGIAGRPGIAASQTQIQGPAIPGPHLSIAHGVKRPLAHLSSFLGEKQVIGQSKGLGAADAADTDGPGQCTAGIGGDGIFHHGAFSFPMQKKGGGGVKAPRPSGSLGYWS